MRVIDTLRQPWVPAVAMWVAVGGCVASWLASGEVPAVLLPLVLFAVMLTGLAVPLPGRTSPTELALRLYDAVDGIETPRLVLRKPTVSDAEAFAATIDHDVVEANGWTGIHQAGQVPAHCEHPEHLLLSWGVLLTERDSGEVAGALDLQAKPGRRLKAEFGWHIGPSHRGKGYGTEAVGAALAALHRAGVAEVRIGTTSANVAVQRVVRKLGLRQVHSGPHRLPNGTTVTSRWYVSEASAVAGNVP